MQFGGLSVPGSGSGFGVPNSGSIGFGSGIGRPFNLIDPGSLRLGEGFDFTLDAQADGEPVKGVFVQMQFSDGSQHNVVGVRMPVFVGNGLSRSNDSAVILTNMGWLNKFSKIHYNRARTSIENMASSLWVHIDTKKNASVNTSTKSGANLRNLLESVGDACKKSSSELISEHKTIQDAVASASSVGQSGKMSDAALKLWSLFVDYIGSETVLADIMDNSRTESVLSYVTGYTPFARRTEHLQIENVNLALDRYVDYCGKGSGKGRALDQHAYEGFNPNAINEEELKKITGTSAVPDRVSTVAEFIGLEKKARHDIAGVCDVLLQQFITSSRIPSGYAYDIKHPVSLHFLLKCFHDNMFKFLGVVEQIQENQETRSSNGHKMFGNPPMTIITERVAEMANYWGVSHGVGDSVYFVKTRAMQHSDEMTKGSWMTAGKNISVTNGVRHFYGISHNPGAEASRGLMSRDSGSRFKPQGGMPSAFGSASSANGPQSNNSKFCFSLGTPLNVGEYIDETPRVDLTKLKRGEITMRRGLFDKSNWTLTKEDRLRVSWDYYGEWVYLPVCGLTVEEMDRLYGYPDLFGNWQSPDIKKIGTIRSCTPRLNQAQSIEIAKKVVSGEDAKTGVPLTRESMLNASGMLDVLTIVLDSKSQNKMALA